MTHKSKLDAAKENEDHRGPSPLECLKTYFKTRSIKLLISKELDNEILRARREAQQRVATALKGKARSRKGAYTKEPKSKKESPNKRLPKVLSMEGLANQQKESSNLLEAIQSNLDRNIVAARRLLMPNQRDQLFKAELNLANIEERMNACHKLISDTPIKEKLLRTKAQKAIQTADKLARREARKKKHNDGSLELLNDANQQAKQLQHALTKHIELQELRLPLLTSHLKKLDEEWQHTQKRINLTQANIRTESTKRMNTIMLKSEASKKSRTEALDRAEQRVCALEATVAATVEDPEQNFEFAPKMFKNFENQVLANEEKARVSLDALENLPAVEPKSMTTKQTSKALADYRRAINEIATVCKNLEVEEADARQLIESSFENMTKWQERHSMAESKENLELAKQAERRAKAYRNTIGQLEESAKLIKSAKESLQQRLDELNLVSTKLEERLKEIDEEKEKAQEKSTNAS